MYTLRPYQYDAVEAGIEVFNSKKKRNGVIVAPTGSGKSLIIASIAKELSGHTLVFQPNVEILKQNLQKTKDFGFDDVGVFSASAGRKDFGKITFGTIGSVINRQNEFGHFDNIIIDECHEVNAKGGMYKDFIDQNGGRVLGLTATPYRMYAFNERTTGNQMAVAQFLHRKKDKVFNKICHVTQVREMYENGYLCPIDYHIDTAYLHSEIELNSTGRDFNQQALKEYNRKQNLVKKVAEAISEHQPNHTLVFCVFVEEAERLSAQLEQLGITSAAISAKTPKKEREQMLADFRSGKIRVMTNVGVLTTGFDFPQLDCVILARPTQSVALYYQMVGRGVRIAEGKEAFKLIDICGNVKRFGRIEEFEIVGGNRQERLKSDVGFLTGVDLITGKDIEAKNFVGYRESEFKKDEIIPFGKHEGTHITKIPNDYLVWLVLNFKDEKWLEIFRKEVARRELPPERLQKGFF